MGLLGSSIIRSAPVNSMTEIVKLNVGGQVFVTTRSTLKNIEGHMLNAMIRHDNPARMIDGAYFIDRNPRMFEWILTIFGLRRRSASGVRGSTKA